jgi:hypothetical protein
MRAQQFRPQALPVSSTFVAGYFSRQLDVAYIASYELMFRDANAAQIARVHPNE